MQRLLQAAGPGAGVAWVSEVQAWRGSVRCDGRGSVVAGSQARHRQK